MLKIILDAGHGGKDPGAVGFVVEKEVTLTIVKSLSYIFSQQKIKSIYTRSDDTFVSVRDRYLFANRIGGDLFLSIHCNSAASSAGQGTETYYYSGKYKPLASKINSGMVDLFGTKDRGVKTAKFAVIRKTVMPALLLELAFVSNPKDGQVLNRLLDERQLRIDFAERIADSIKSLL